MKLFLSDLDGTLLFGKHDIHQQDRKAIQQLQKEGFLFGIATGRDYGFCKQLISRYELPIEVMILNNGGSVMVNGKTTMEMTLDKSGVMDILTFLKPFVDDLNPFICDETSTFYLMKNAYDEKRWKGIKKELAYLGNIHDIDVLEALLELKEPIIKLSIYVRDETKTESFLKMIQQVFAVEYEVLMTSSDYIEITRKGVHKGNALLHVEQYLKLDRKHICVIGDGENDISLLDLAGFSFVMDSAKDAVKRHGDHIVTSVAEAIAILLHK